MSLCLDEMMTLSVLSSELHAWMLKISLVYSLYISGVAAAASLPTNSLKSSHLLSVLYNSVLEHDALGQFTPDMVGRITYNHDDHGNIFTPS